MLYKSGYEWIRLLFINHQNRWIGIDGNQSLQISGSKDENNGKTAFNDMRYKVIKRQKKAEYGKNPLIDTW